VTEAETRRNGQSPQDARPASADPAEGTPDSATADSVADGSSAAASAGEQVVGEQVAGERGPGEPAWPTSDPEPAQPAAGPRRSGPAAGADAVEPQSAVASFGFFQPSAAPTEPGLPGDSPDEPAPAVVPGGAFRPAGPATDGFEAFRPAMAGADFDAFRPNQAQLNQTQLDQTQLGQARPHQAQLAQPAVQPVVAPAEAVPPAPPVLPTDVKSAKDNSPEDGQAGALSRRAIMWVFIGLMLGMFLAALDQMIVATAIRTIADDLHGLDLQAWATTAYLITSTISTPLYGKLSDIYGRKSFFLAAIVIFIIGSAACTFANSMYMLAAFRAFQGLGAGGLMSLALSIIGDVVPPRQRAKYQGYFLAVFGTASVLGPVLGGFLAGRSEILHIAGWRWVFLVNVPIAIIALITVAKVLNLPRRRARVKQRIDWWGALTITVCLVPLLIIAEQGEQWGWRSERAYLCYGIGIVGLVLFLVVERLMGDDALIPLRLFRNGVFSVVSAVGLIIGMGMFGGLAVIPQYLQIVKGASPTKAGLLVLPIVLGIMIGSILSGQITSRTGRYKIFPIFGIALMTAGLLLLNTINAQTALSTTDIWMGIFGLGLGLCMQTLILAVQNAVPARDMGVSTSSQVFFRQTGGTIGTAVFLSILFSVVGGKIAAAFTRIVPTVPFQAALHDPAVVHNPNNAIVLNLLRSGGAGIGGNAGGVLQDSSFIQRLDPRLALPFQEGFADSMHPVFLTAAIVVAVGFVLIWFMKEVPLRTESGLQARLAEDGGGSDGAPPRTDGRHALVQSEQQNQPAQHQAPEPTAGATSMASVSEGYVQAPTDGTPIHGHVRRSDGHAIVEAALTLIDPSGRQVGRGVSGGDGGYRLAAPAPGTYVLIASAPAHQPQAAAVPVGGVPVSLDVVLTGTSGLAGTVVSVGTGAPIAGGTATLADERGEVVGSLPTGSDGRYAFGELVAGHYTLVVSADGYQPAALSVSVPGTGECVQDVALVGGSRLRGTATSGDGRPVPDARITLLDRAGNVVGMTTTDPTGEYGFSDLPEGEYTVIASGYPPVASTLRVDGGEYGEHDVRLGHPQA
jgi:EmrB/QacA subfamily drug resistance transporter